MEFTVNAYIIDQNFHILLGDVWEWMPNSMEFIACPRYGHSVFNNIFYESEIKDEGVLRMLSDIHPNRQWMAFIRLGDVLEYMTEQNLSLAHRVALQDYDYDLVLMLSSNITMMLSEFEEPSRTYGWIDPWYLRRANPSYHQERVYQVGCREDCNIIFYTAKECEQFLGLMATKNFPLEWKGPVQIMTSNISDSQEETLDISVREAVDAMCEWAKREFPDYEG